MVIDPLPVHLRDRISTPSRVYVVVAGDPDVEYEKPPPPELATTP